MGYQKWLINPAHGDITRSESLGGTQRKLLWRPPRSPALPPDASPTVDFGSLTPMWALDSVTDNWCGHFVGDTQSAGSGYGFL